MLLWYCGTVWQNILVLLKRLGRSNWAPVWVSNLRRPAGWQKQQLVSTLNTEPPVQCGAGGTMAHTWPGMLYCQKYKHLSSISLLISSSSISQTLRSSQTKKYIFKCRHNKIRALYFYKINYSFHCILRWRRITKLNFQTFFIMYFPCERQITSPISTNFLETTGTSNQKSFNQNLYIALLFELPAKHTRYY